MLIGRNITWSGDLRLWFPAVLCQIENGNQKSPDKVMFVPICIAIAIV